MQRFHAQHIDIDTLAARVTQGAEDRPRVFIGIDGPGASGKTTFAAQLVASLNGASLVHVDDFYLPSSRRQERDGEIGALIDLPRLAHQVIQPGSVGTTIRYQRYNWERDELAEWVDIPSGAPIVLEGVFCLVEEFRYAYTFKIWCRADPTLRLARGLARDGENARSLWTELWMPAEADYATKQNPERIADLVVDSSSDGICNPLFRAVQ